MTRGGRGTALCLLLVSAMVVFHCFSTSSLAADPIKIGYLLSLSGVYAALGEDLRDGLNLYMDEIGNKAGGRDI